MAPFADFLFFGVMLYLIIPTILLGLFGRANTRWSTVANIIALLVIFAGDLLVRPKVAVPFIAVVVAYGVYQTMITYVFFRWRSKPLFYATVALSILPLAAAKFLPLIPETSFGFIGISYVT